MTKYLSYNSWENKSIPVSENRGRGINPWGYRNGNLHQRGTMNVLSLGCSWTEGSIAVPSFTVKMCESLAEYLGCDVRNFNFAMGGRSNDYIARMLFCLVDQIKPDAVVFCFTGMYRREYHTPDGRRMKWLIDWISESENNGPHWRCFSDGDKKLLTHLNNITSPYDDTVNFLKNYKLMELLLDSKKIPWGFSMIPAPPTVQAISELLDSGWMDKKRYLGEPYEITDQAAPDDYHPGPVSVARYAKKFSDWLISNYGMELKSAAEKKIVRKTVSNGASPSTHVHNVKTNSEGETYVSKNT